MNTFFEEHNENEIKIIKKDSHEFPAHFHLDMEVFLLKKGDYTITINDNEYEMTENSIAVFDGLDIHAYFNKQVSSKDITCALIIPNKFLTSFNELRRNLKIENPVIIDEKLCDEILFIIENYLNKDVSEYVKTSSINLILSLIYEKLRFTESKNQNNELIREILKYIQSNFKNNITLNSLANVFNYNSVYVSRIFHKF
ncbi:MAG: hypothetical protein IKT32_00085, partial [Clostridia bacterium]|nr:hypothetical protein [Clostridia bacterium]